MSKNIIEYVGVDKLIPYARNSRTHSETQITKIAASIREFGFTNPVLIDDDNGIIAGHARVMAASKLDMVEVPCIRLGYLTKAQKKAYILADNRIALDGGWDEAMLSLELTELQEMDFNLDLIGFDKLELDDLFLQDGTREGEDNFDVDAELAEPPVAKIGEVWKLGKHRLMCGDSTIIKNISVLTNGVKCDTVFIDPPYDREELYETIPNNNEHTNLLVMCDHKHFASAIMIIINHKWKPQYELIWDCCQSWYTPNRPLARHKTCYVCGENPFWDFEKAIIHDGKYRGEKRIVHNTRGDCEYIPLDGAVHLRTVEAFPNTNENDEHGHGKPVEWITAILNGVGASCVLDLFGGSGTTLIACEKSNKSCYMMELDPKYCDVIINRWETFTNRKAEIES